jgi:hypothetical protein
LRVVKYLSEPPEYRIETPQGSIRVDAATLITQSRFRIAIAEITDRYIPEFTKKGWRMPVQALLSAAEPVDLGQDATDQGEMAELLRAYLFERTVHETPEEADSGREPFWEREHCCIYIEGFKLWLLVRHNEKVTQQKLAARLRDFKAEPITNKNLIIKNKATSRRYWRLPEGDWIPSREK